MRLPSTSRTHLMVSVAVVAALSLAACGSSSSGTPSAGASSGAATAGPTPTGAPVKIGLINQENETVAFPEGSAAAKAAVAYLNAEKGGIAGRPAELVLCTAGDSAESAVACANKFANDPTVPLVINNTYNSAAVSKILVGRKAMFTFNNDIPDMTTPNLFTLDPGVIVPTQVIAQILLKSSVKTVSVMYTNDPYAVETGLPLVVQSLEGAGIQVKQKVPVDSGGDYTAAVAAADPASVDGLVMLLIDNSQCAPVGKALKTLASTAVVVSADICSAPVAAASGNVDGWQFAVTNTGSFDESTPGPGTLDLRRLLTTYSSGEPNFATLAGYTAAHVLAAADIYAKVGLDNLTPDAINQLLNTGWKAELMSYAPVACPGGAPFIGECGTSMYWAKVTDGKLGPASDEPITVDLAPFASLAK